MPKRGDVVLIPFPFTDLSGQKIRPAVILSAYNKEVDIIVVFITSKHKSTKDFIVPVKPTAQNGIKVSSVIMCDKISTLDRKMIIGSIGTLEPDLQNRVDQKVAKALGLKLVLS